ncbi:hypothetical protein B0A48_10238 [Cryoendolithus antarcticus]|uniref:2EXR domain-containing protein n=1 Tax=Cryoendolithus antarcticus TaxID=1507870 RepID=A0A1V8SWX2_9PEZI|nr:hypothetical protein B0A48_10238 [Cryoendolithus antarcticus]
MSTSEQIFHPFLRLPLELREQIWRYCIPDRVRELDYPVPETVFSNQSLPCRLGNTSRKNTYPPLITEVCRESRKVAHETGIYLTEAADPASAEWDAATIIHEIWHDSQRESLHLNWAHEHEDDCYSRGNALEYLVRVAQCKPVSLTAEYLFESRMKVPHDLEWLNQRTNWQVVVHTIVVHSPIRPAAVTGLFGLLGDARVQIIDVGDFERVKQCLHLAETCEQGRDITISQDFTLETIWYAAERLREHVVGVYRTDLTARIRPAVMFRLCTQMCNDRTVVGARERAMRAPPVRGRGRNRGRG